MGPKCRKYNSRTNQDWDSLHYKIVQGKKGCQSFAILIATQLYPQIRFGSRLARLKYFSRNFLPGQPEI